MSVKGKKALGTVVECIETTEEASALLNVDFEFSSPQTNPTLDEKTVATLESEELASASRRQRTDDVGRMFRPNRSNVKTRRRATIGGSRLSLTSIFTFASSRKNPKNQRRRSGPVIRFPLKVAADDLSTRTFLIAEVNTLV
ncbi:hypothetical protein Tcan_02811 [Toxocara canis]|uniref:Uncharacterized protein n=1 Tax=Toxocara canis TaxID=6265 RepID=A0A0B2UST7_TOXCA|nr:hypothetical protein Tcan_02811 [Toxocara canis]